MKKRMLSLALAILLICAMAIPTYAATYSDTGSYTGTTGTCTYHAYATCRASSWQALLEWTGSTDSYANYSFRVVVSPYKYVSGGQPEPMAPVDSGAVTRIASIYRSVDYTVHRIDVVYRINGSQVGSTRTVYAT